MAHKRKRSHTSHTSTKSSRTRRARPRHRNPGTSDLVGVAIGAVGGVAGDYALISLAKLDPRTAGMVEAAAGVAAAAFLGSRSPMIRNAGIGLAAIGGVRLLSSYLSGASAAKPAAEARKLAARKSLKGLGAFYVPTIGAMPGDVSSMLGDGDELGAMLSPSIGDMDGVELSDVDGLGGVELSDVDGLGEFDGLGGVELAEIDGLAEAEGY